MQIQLHSNHTRSAAGLPSPFSISSRRGIRLTGFKPHLIHPCGFLDTESRIAEASQRYVHGMEAIGAMSAACGNSWIGWFGGNNSWEYS